MHDSDLGDLDWLSALDIEDLKRAIREAQNPTGATAGCVGAAN